MSAILRKIGRLRAKSGGGSAANTMAALSRMGYDCGFIGRAGDDPEGDFLLESLQGLDTSRIKRGGLSGHCISILNETGERALIINPATNSLLDIDDVDTDYLTRQARLVYMTSFVGTHPLLSQKALAAQLPKDVTLAFDPGEIYVQYKLAGLRDIVRRCRFIFITTHELEILTGKPYNQGAFEVLKEGPQAVICKCGARGVEVFGQEERFFIPAEKVDVVDKTGAGDVLAAGFLAGWLMNLPLYVCAQIGQRCAARSITAPGRQHYPDKVFLAQILARLEAERLQAIAEADEINRRLQQY